MRRPFAGLVAGTAAAVLTALVACGASKPGVGVQPTPESVSLAARRTIATPSGRFAFTLTSTSGDERASLSGDGSYDNVRRRWALRMDLSSLGEAGVDALEARFVEGVAYVKLPTPGSKWTRYDPAALGAAGAPLGATLADPSGFLSYLLSAEGLLGAEGSVELGGRRSVRGVETTRLALGAPRRAEVFLDNDGLVRRLRLELLAATEPGGPVTEVEVDYFDFGAEVVIDAPRPG